VLSSDVQALHLSRSPFTAQRRAAAARLDPQHARVLDLQRQAGNKAVTQMVSAQRQAAGAARVQRTMTVRAGDLRRQFVLRGTYGKIVRALADFEGSSRPEARLRYATMLRGLCNTWLQTHQGPTSPRDKQQRQQIEQLEAEAFREMGVLAAQQAYLKGFDASAPGAGPAQGPSQLPGVAPNGRGYLKAPFDPNQQFGQFAGLSMGAKVNAAGPARSLEAGRTHEGSATAGAGKAALAFASKYKLTAAEIAAIRTYSFPDYAYIVPAAANSPKYVKQGLENSLDPSLKRLAGSPRDLNTAMKEGALHTGMLMQALAKIEPYTKTGYRGERLTASEFYKRYVLGAEISGADTESGESARGVAYNRFGSASKRRSVAEGYSQGAGSGDQKIGADQTVSVLLELELTNAREIEKLSGSPKGEYEVLILPGAKFVITGIQKVPEKDRVAGSPPATHWAIVRLKQIA
jgi:hypothetical protein